jgi:ribose transport system substrate-binding protein
MADDRNSSRYFVEAAAKTLDVLESFSDSAEQLSITEIARRARLPYTSAFRFLHTLEKRGYVMRAAGKKRFMLAPARKRIRVGYAALGKIPFATEVTRSMIAAARRFGVALFALDNEDSPTKTLANVDQLFAEGIDILVEFQRNETLSHLIASKCHNAGVPAIAINFPQPGAYYFGPDSYKTGALAAEFLLDYGKTTWTKKQATCLVLPSKGLGSTQKTRKVALLETLRRPLPTWPAPQLQIGAAGVTTHDGYAITRAFVRNNRRESAPLLVAAFSDALAIGAERALREANLQNRSVIVGQGGTADARRHILRGGPFKASVAYFPETYGERVIQLATKLFEGGRPPLVNYTDHVVLTKETMSDFYGAATSQAEEAETILL